MRVCVSFKFNTVAVSEKFPLLSSIFYCRNRTDLPWLSRQSALCSHILVKNHIHLANTSLSLSRSGSIYTAHTHTYVLIRASGSRRQSTRLRENALVLVGALSLPVGTSGSTQTLSDGSREKHLTLPLCAATAPCLPKNFKALVELR